MPDILSTDLLILKGKIISEFESMLLKFENGYNPDMTEVIDLIHFAEYLENVDDPAIKAIINNLLE